MKDFTRAIRAALSCWLLTKALDIMDYDQPDRDIEDLETRIAILDLHEKIYP